MISEIASRATVQIGQQQFSNTLSDSDRFRVEESVRLNNLENQVQYGREMKQVMDKDDFLKILITQLQNQDPTAPMEDREFIAQMAQFSSLEQMTNLTQNVERLSAMLASGNALNVLGKEVDLIVNGEMITGQVSEVTRGDFPQVFVNGRYFDFSDIQRVREL